MSKTISYKGKLAMGLQDKLNLATLNGKTGYKVKKFQILSTTPGVGNVEYVAKITTKDDSASIASTVDFTDADIVAVAYLQDNASSAVSTSETIIFDNEIFNQNAFVNITDASGGTVECNYYIELETVSLSDIESTMLTLKSLRTVASR
tara:strand:+ start:655 stop:1101 length:447 start_codon:yes stop_codon:yes gene_type:complete